MEQSRLLILGASALLVGTLALAAPAAPSYASDQLKVYVSPTGTSGSRASCEPTAPCTLQQAQAKVRANSSSMSSDIDVILADGTYRLSSTFTLSNAAGDSGTNGHQINYRSAPGAHPVLSGGQSVSGWTQVGSTALWQADVPSGVNTRQLWVNGVRAERARGDLPGGVVSYTSTGVILGNWDVASWSRPADLELVMDRAWETLRCGVASASENVLTMDQPCWDNVTKRQLGLTPSDGGNTYVENARELLDTPGEFYLNSATHTLYYEPRPGENLATADVELPRLQTLVSASGTLSSPLTNVTFQGLTFSHSTWLDPSSSDGFADAQASVRFSGVNAYQYQGTCTRLSATDPGSCPYGAWTMTPAAIEISNATGVHFVGDTFRALGAAGVDFGAGTSSSSIQSSELTDIAGSGVQIGNVADAQPVDSRSTPTGNVIADNWVHAVAADYASAVGIFQGYASATVIEHNQLNDLPYSGISIGWGWGHILPAVSANVVQYNNVFDVMKRLSDGAAIYSLGRQGMSLATGLVVKGNVVHVGSPGDNHASKGYYLDGGTQYVTVSGNVSFAASSNIGGCQEGEGTTYGDFTIVDNYFSDTSTSFTCGGTPPNFVLSGTSIITGLTDAPVSIVARAGVRPGASDPANLAAGAVAQALYLDGSPATLQPTSSNSFATDGDTSTTTQAFGQYRWQDQLDLGSVQSIARVMITEPADKFATAFHIDISTDGTTWSTAGSVSGLLDGGHQDVYFPVSLARYVRVIADAPNAGGQLGGQMGLSEVAVYGPVSLSQGRPAQALFMDGSTATLQPGNQVGWGVDGDPTTWTQAYGQYRWQYLVDLGSLTTVGRFTILEPSDKFGTAFHLDTSTDGSSFTTVKTVAGLTAGGRYDFTISPVSARYVRLVVDAPSSGGQLGGQMAISELGVFSG